MFSMQLVGAILLLGGLVYMAWSAIQRGRMSDPSPKQGDVGKRTLEPRQRGLGFLGWRANWPGLVSAAVGALLLLSSLL
jgi:hypothetical protein